MSFVVALLFRVAHGTTIKLGQIATSVSYFVFFLVFEARDKLCLEITVLFSIRPTRLVFIESRSHAHFSEFEQVTSAKLMCKINVDLQEE